MTLRTLLTATLCLTVFAACRQAGPEPGGGQGRPAPPPAEAGPLVVFLGDSLTAGYGLSEKQVFPALLEETRPEVAEAGECAQERESHGQVAAPGSPPEPAGLFPLGLSGLQRFFLGFKREHR